MKNLKKKNTGDLGEEATLKTLQNYLSAVAFNPGCI